MQSKIVIFILILIAAISGTGLAADIDHAPVTLLTSSDIRGSLTAADLRRCYLRLAREWNIKPSDLPRVVVFHVSKKTAEGVYLKKDVNIRMNSGETIPAQYYEIWLVGDAKLKYVLALENILEDHFGMKITNEQRNGVIARVSKIQDATISVNQGHRTLASEQGE